MNQIYEPFGVRSHFNLSKTIKPQIEHPVSKDLFRDSGHVKTDSMNENDIPDRSNAPIDVSAFKQIFLEYYEGVFRYALTILKDAEDAEDTVQTVFTELWNDRNTIIIHTSVQAFLYKAVYFKCMNKLKHKKVVQKFVMAGIRSEEQVHSDSMIYAEIVDTVRQTIQKLPEQCRKIFTMSRFEGLKYNDIAKELQLSPKTVENQMGKALRTMRIALSDYLKFIIIILITPQP